MRRDYDFGHNDMDMPNDLPGLLRWYRRVLLYSHKNAERWGMSPFALEDLKLGYQQAKADLEKYGPEPPPPVPHAIDGFTIYWDKRRRFEELLCDCLDIPVDDNGVFDRKELILKLSVNKGSEWMEKWKEYLMGHIERNAARYNMPPEWVENIRTNLYEVKAGETPPDDGNDGMRQMFLTFYKLR